MQPAKSFRVFGEAVDVLVTSESTNNSFCMMVQTSPPGGGPPPHSHKNEDEIFTVIEGEFELFDGSTWTRIAPGEPAHALRNGVHTFRNAGTTDGRIHVVAIPGGMDRYLEEIAPLEMPRDMARLIEISDRQGITFVGM